ncbi:MAG: PAS domain S-box protein [Desulfarculaceae bacterium]|nr:PAS domain S-box protein [Desulfarculaceae bacterium]
MAGKELEYQLSLESMLGVIHDSADGILVLDPEGTVLLANPAAEEILQRRGEELVGKRFGVPVHGQDHPIEIDMLTPDGLTVPVELWSRNTLWEGRPAFRASLRDLSERRAAEKALRQSEAALIEAQGLARVGSWHYDVANDTAFWSAEMYRIFDRDPEREPPSWADHAEHIHPDDWERIDRIVQAAAEQGRPYREEFRIRRRDGSITWAETIGRPQKDQHGVVTKVSGTVQDISERKQAEKALAESERKYRLLYTSIRDAILVADTERKIIDCNPEFSAAFGYSLEEIKGKKTSVVYDSEAEFARMGREMKNHPGQPFVITVTYRRKNGEAFPGETGVYHLTNEAGQAEGFIGVIRDVSEKTAAEQALRNSLESLQQAEEIANLGYFERNWQTGEGYWSEGFFRLLGIGGVGGAFTHQEFMHFLHPEDLERVREHIQTTIAQHLPMNVEFRIVRQDGAVLHIRGIGRNFYSESGAPLLTRGTFQDITAPKQAQEALLSERNRSQKYLDTAGVILLALDPEGRIEMINRRGAELLGLPAEELAGRNWIDNFIPGEMRPQVRQIHQDICTGKLQQHMHAESPVLTASGERREVRWFNTVLKDSQGNITGTLSSGEDFTERKAAQEAVNRLAAIVESSQDAIIGVDLEGIVTSWNRAAQQIYGYSAEEIFGQQIRVLVPEDRMDEMRQEVRRVRQGKSTRVHETVRRCKDGSLVDVSLSVSPVFDGQGEVTGASIIAHSIASMIKDREEREKLESQLRQSQKMEAIGTLAGGIAHDFNNILAAIMGYSELALTELQQGTETAQYVQTVIEAAKRAKDLTYQILSFSRQSEHKKVLMNLKPLAKEVIKMLRATLPATIEIRQSLAAGDSKILADPVQIHQILMNLCTNAAHAMAETGGVLGVDLGLVEIEEADASGYMDIVPGKYQRLSVSDTGVGMNKEVMERIFEPFFTTKEVGKGTGMGLSVAHGIVSEYGGTIRVYSEPGEGSTFHVYLPLEVQGHQADQDREPPEALRGDERVILVDDEAPLVDIGQTALTRLGYRVWGFTSPEKALEAFREAPHEYDLLMTDYTMPGMTGAELAQEFKKIRPEMPIVMCTGFSERLTSATSQEAGVSHLAMKPLMPKEMGRIIREVLSKD